MKALVIVCCIAIAASLPSAAAAQKAKGKKGGKSARVKIEKLQCRVGTENEHARIAVQLANGKVESFAYYSKWKPQTCSMDVQRGDPYSAWEDTGNVTVVTLLEDKGAFLIDHSPGRYHFIFRNIDRMRYCGMEGKVSGSLTVFKGRPQCVLEGVMDKDGREIVIPPPPGGAQEAGKAGSMQTGAAVPGGAQAEEGTAIPGSGTPEGKAPEAMEPESYEPSPDFWE
jgi:hypothetical protein